ncbi:MAG: hemolysin family protein [Prolixibacteraceae bacterium]
MEIIILGFLILLNGFFSLSEIALVSSKRTRLEQLHLKGSKGAGTALRLLSNSGNFLSAVQVGITLIGIITGVYGGMNIADDVTPFFEQFELTSVYAHEIALTLTVIVITYISIVIGELVPKTVALSNPEQIAVTVAPFIGYFSAAFYPFVKLLAVSTYLVTRIIGVKKHAEHMTEAELRQIIRHASYEGVIEREQNIMHEKVFYFSDKKAKHIMTHRTDVEWLDISKPEEELRLDIRKVQHSKVICSEENLDNFKGILYLKDYYKSKALAKEPHIGNLLVQPVVVPENADAKRVLNQLRQRKIHIAVVVNEYGGLEGIITLHDIIENIVGQIPEEGENYEPDVFKRDDQSVLVNGEASVETLTEIIENFTIDFDKIDYSTVAGFVFEQINDIPRTGDKINYQDYTIEIVDMDGNRIDKILIYKKK